MDVAEVGEWLDRLHRRYDEFAYRYVYRAYLVAEGGVATGVGEVTMHVGPDGSYLLRSAGDEEDVLCLATDAERREFVDYLRRRYCGDRYRDMREWEAARHADYRDELNSWRPSP